METTVTLEPEVYDLTAAYAQAKGLTVSAALSELVRQSEGVRGSEIRKPRRRGHVVKGPNGYLIITGAGPITPETVNELSEDPVD